MRAAPPDNYTYAETNYANPHAPTSFFDGVATTTYAYDANGNLTGTTGAATSTFMWDYRNRMIAAWVSGATSTYAYDHTVARVAQATPTTTTHYPSKFYAIEYQGAGTTTATSTSYIFHGDTLVAYIEQQIADGQATGTPITYYVHPDHLGSTNVVTDEEGDVVEALDYYPYGAERIHTGSTDADRTFIGQFGDDATELSYLNARYYDGSRGQFTSQDAVFQAIGDPRTINTLTKTGQDQFLADPQRLNSYNYGGANPITNKDPSGNCFEPASAVGCALLIFAADMLIIDAIDVYQTSYSNLSDVYSQEEKNRTWLKLGYDFVAGVTGQALSAAVSPTAGLAFEFLSTGKDGQDAISEWFGLDKEERNMFVNGNTIKAQVQAIRMPTTMTTQGGGSGGGASNVWSGSGTGSTPGTATPYLPAGASVGSGGMVRNVIVGSMSNGAPIFCSGLCR